MCQEETQVKPQVPTSHCQDTAWQTLGSPSLKIQEERVHNIEKNVNITISDILTHTTKESIYRNEENPGGWGGFCAP